MNKRQLSDLRADIAVMLILRALGIQPGGVLDHEQLVTNWPEYGLATGELRTALARLMLRGHLRAVARPDVEQVRLTERGARWMQEVPAWLEYQLIVPSRSACQLSRLLGIQAPRPTIDPLALAGQRAPTRPAGSGQPLGEQPQPFG